MAEGESVKVAVRVRPFNTREKDRNSKCCIRMDDKMTIITNPENGVSKNFTFDYSYWSHDGENTLADGYNEPAGPGMGTDGATYADQQKVFDELGQGVLKNAYEGFNSCLFAYGQTGSGKSYSMVGYGVNKGIVPIACDEIFKAIELKKSDKFQFQVTIQMLEIYNEQVRDLFAKSTPAGGLKVRMNPKSGVEVVGLTEWPVGSYKEIDERIETATKNRTVAATQMNATSSRAHTVVTITYTQLEINAKGPGKHSEKKAKMNLVDLAGSERAESTGATGDRLKEGAAINLSLTMLGNVITALAEKSNNPNKKVLVPYRDSKLTCILQDALGGNAKTIMICALSPADINYEETLGTLRYADRAKQIKNKPKVNVDPTELLIQQLKAENERLKAMGGAGEPTMVGMSEEEKEAMRKQMEQEMASKMADNERMMAEMSKSWEEKLKEAQALAQTDKEAGDSDGARKAKEAHILNIHEDPVLSRAICYFFPPGQTTTVGNRAHPAGEDILLGGVSIRAQHCKIASEGAGLALSVRTDEKCKVVLNGKEVAGDGIALRHNDRLMLGSNYYFVVVNPPEAGGAPEGGWPDVDWDYFQREIAKEQGLDMDVNWASMSEEEKRRALLNDELVQVMPRVTEANDLSGAMQRGIAFETRITPVMSRTEGMVSVVMVKVTNASTGHVFMWDKAKFINRVYLMREQYEKFEQGEIDLATLEPENDPFWDPNEPMQVGQATVFLKPLAYCMTVSDDYPVYFETAQEGIMSVRMEPCKPDGSLISEEEDGPYDDVEEPKDLLGKRLDLLVCINHARGINKAFSSEVSVSFELSRCANPNSEDGAFRAGNAYFQVWGLQGDSGKGGASAGKRKALSAAEVQELQAALKKTEEARDKNMASLATVQELTLAAAQRAQVAEHFVHAVADALADVGFDIDNLMDAATQASAGPAPAATPRQGDAGGASPEELAAARGEAAQAQAALSVERSAGEAAKARVAELEAQVGEMRAAAAAGSGQGDVVAQLQEELAAAKGAEGRLGAELAALQAEREAFRAKELGWTEERARLEAAAATPGGGATPGADPEKAALQQRATKLQAELDLARAEAQKAAKGSKGCGVM